MSNTKIQTPSTEMVELPSGNRVEVEKSGVSRFRLARAGLTSDRFAPIFRLMYGEAQEGDAESITADDIMVFQAKLLCLTIRNPKMVEDAEDADPDSDIYWIGELPEEDIEFLTTDQLGGDPEEDSFPDGGGSPTDSDDGKVLADDASADDGVPAGKPKGGADKSNTRTKSKPRGKSAS